MDSSAPPVPFDLSSHSLPLLLRFNWEVKIREAELQDLPGLEWDGLYTKYRALYHHTFSESLLGRRAMILAVLNNQPIGQVFVQLARGKTLFADGSSRAYQYALRVMAPFRGNGIGTALIRAAEALMYRRGFRWATIAVAKDNVAARRLYERLGYRIAGDDPGQWRYTDPEGTVHHVSEPCWALEKPISVSNFPSSKDRAEP